MKTFIVMFLCVLPLFVKGEKNCSTVHNLINEQQETTEIKSDVPKFLEKAMICVRLADGKESCVPAEKFKVVPRKQQFIVSKVTKKDVILCEDEKEKNRVSLLGGTGPKKGLDVSKNASQVTVESQSGAVGGLQYQRLITDTISIGGQAQTNDSLLLNVGVDF